MKTVKKLELPGKNEEEKEVEKKTKKQFKVEK